MTALTINSTVKLRSGGLMPLLGFGVYQSLSATNSVTTALKEGYRHIDSARIYRNEVETVKAVKEFESTSTSSSSSSGVQVGGKVWLTSKVTGKEHGTVKTKIAVEESIERAGKEGYKWDLFLLHDPTSGPVRRLEAWKVLESKVKDGSLKAIGVSNFSDKHLQEFKDAGVEFWPEVNQIELHPWCQQKTIVEYCKRTGIIVQAYCPIVRGSRFNDPVLQAISKEINQSPASILIRWSLQKGYVPLPKSDTPSRIKSNSDVFGWELSAENMSRLDALDEGAKGACSWNPVSVL